MSDVKRIAIVPAYEPDSALNDVAAELKENGFDVVVINDGSGSGYDGVFAAAEEYAAILEHEVNRGKGAAIKTGLRYISEKYTAPYTVVTVDADGQHKVKDAVRICETAEQHSDSLVLGSRRFTGKIPLRSRFGNTVTRFVYRMASGVKVYDTQTGLRAFSAEALPRMQEIEGERYEYEMNVLMRLAKEKIPIREEWIETVYLNDNSSSHFKAVKDSCRIYKEILKFSASSLIGFCVDYAMYCLLFGITGKPEISNIAARVVSASVNYTLNRKMVFKSKASVWKSALQYFALAAGILACNTLLLKLLTSLGVNAYLAKIPVEIVMFAVSWLVQHRLIFKNTGDRGPSGKK